MRNFPNMFLSNLSLNFGPFIKRVSAVGGGFLVGGIGGLVRN
ncbi:MAG: hypothetical protein CM15mP111_3660 [Hyphomicrobiales bacterium]|nr:MAG: hypothetical protein CM15mP111_3660 [Hyphomicrobiales bacterium]